MFCRGSFADRHGYGVHRKVFNDVIAQEQTFLTTNSLIKIQEKSDELHGIIGQIPLRTPAFLTNSFEWLKGEQAKTNDQNAAKSLIDAGKFAIESQNWDRLKEINYGLLDQLPKTTREQLNTKIGFGL